MSTKNTKRKMSSSLWDIVTKPNPRMQPTALRAHKSAVTRAFSSLFSEGAHAAPARRVMRGR